MRIVLYGSRKPILQGEALAIFSTGVNNQIRLEPEWIPREENEFANYLSRIVNHDDWMLNPVVFQDLDVMWGPHTIDRFADVHNRQLERFDSQYWNPCSEAVDAFTCDWSKENNWLVVPSPVSHPSIAQTCRSHKSKRYPSDTTLAISTILAYYVSRQVTPSEMGSANGQASQ